MTQRGIATSASHLSRPGPPSAALDHYPKKLVNLRDFYPQETKTKLSWQARFSRVTDSSPPVGLTMLRQVWVRINDEPRPTWPALVFGDYFE